MATNLNLKAGEWVQVRAREEILATLDKSGKLEGLQFMPEMFAFCGRRLRVYKRAHKTCDTVHSYLGRRMKSTVHLDEIRCDGGSHGGCQANCLIFWKEAWLVRVSANGKSGDAPERPGLPASAVGLGGGSCSEADVMVATQVAGTGDAAGPVYACQATLLPSASEPLHWREWRQYLEDYTSGNVGLWRMFRGVFYMAYNGVAGAGIGLGGPLRWLYDVTAPLRGGYPYPRRWGTIPAGERTPGGTLNLQAGDWVRVKSYREILATLDSKNRNRGLYFDAEMVPYCGRTFRVLARVTRILEEKTGKMQEFKNPCIMLEGTVCQSRYSECRLFCPRSIHAYWREIWLEKIPPDEAPVAVRERGGAALSGR